MSGLPGQPIGLDWVGCWVMVVLGWGHFGGTLVTFWGHVGDVLGTLRCWGHFGAVLGHFEEFWGILGALGELFVGLGSVGCQVNPLG